MTSVLKFSKTKKKKSPFLYLHAVPGFGKTTFAAQAPDPVIIQTPNETGYETLLQGDRVPLVPHATATDFRSVISTLQALEKQKCKTVVLDSVTDLVSVAVREVLQKKYRGDTQRFNSYGAGKSVVKSLVDELVVALYGVNQSGKMVIVLGHSAPAIFRNPSGDDYHVWMPEMDDAYQKTLHRPFDAILFGELDHPVEDGKVLSPFRQLLTDHGHALAKNRYGLPSIIPMGDDYKNMYSTFRDALKESFK